MYRLFYEGSLVDQKQLRATAGKAVLRSRLVNDCAAGNLSAVAHLKVGFWPFVRDFERAIDRRRLPRQPLREKFGSQVTSDRLLEIARCVKTMREEEGSHARAWERDAASIGIHHFDRPIAPAIESLIAMTNTKSLLKFFAALAATEFIAEELSARLTKAPSFVALFPNRVWTWGDLHLAHHGGPSHLDVDLDLARSYSKGPDKLVRADIERTVLETIALFGIAADEVMQGE